MMKHLFTLTILSLLITWVSSNNYAVIGETGAGKSTFISSIFGVNAPTGRFDSCTNITMKYQASSKAVPAFQGSNVYDTPGTYDTTGKTNQEIMTEIEGYYLRQMNVSEVSSLDGFIAMIDSKPTRLRLKDLMNTFISSFSRSILKSMVIVINWHASERLSDVEKLKEVTEHMAAGITYAAFPDEIVKIPCVILNANNPTQEQINALVSALSKVSKYQLLDMDQKRKEIEKIYERMMADSENYKTEVEKIINEVEHTIEEQTYIKVPKTFTNEKVEGCKVSLSIPGILSFCIPNKVSEQVTLLVDELTTVMKKENHPVVEEKLKQILKNEQQVYWDRAVTQYEEENRKKYVKNQVNLEL